MENDEIKIVDEKISLYRGEIKKLQLERIRIKFPFDRGSILQTRSGSLVFAGFRYHGCDYEARAFKVKKNGEVYADSFCLYGSEKTEYFGQKYEFELPDEGLSI